MTILHQVDISTLPTDGKVLDFNNNYELNQEILDNALKNSSIYIVNSQGERFLPFTLRLGDIQEDRKNERLIYLHIRRKDDTHYILTQEQYEDALTQIEEQSITTGLTIEDIDVVIFITYYGEESQYSAFKDYLKDKYNIEIF